jgi:hypothetical protein
MRRRRPAFSREPFSVTVMTILSLCATAARADQVNLSGELGAEYDNNVHWADSSNLSGPPRVGSSLGRMVLGVSAADRIGARQDVSFSLLGAAKAFAAQQARNENVGVIETYGAWRLALGQRTHLGINGAYYEAIQAGTEAERELSGVARDFRSLSPALRVARVVGQSGTLALAGGYRWFVYKPAHAYDFRAPALAVEYRLTTETTDGAADWETTATAGVELRRFAGTRLVPESPCPSPPCAAVPDLETANLHVDQFFAGRLDITRVGQILVGAGYAIQWNRSNSYSETLLRHVGTLRLTTPLPLGLYLATRLELVFVFYPDHAAFPAGPSGQSRTTIEDENRSQLRAELSRKITTELQLLVRYSLYVNAIGQNSYQRQTATLSLAFAID